MSDQPTGVFVRLPLSDAQREQYLDAINSGEPLEAEASALESGILAIGTPVTGGKEICSGSVKWHENDVEPVLETYAPNAFGRGTSVKIVTLSDYQVHITALEAEVVRLRGGLEKAHLSAILGDVDPIADLECCRKHIEEALKGGAV